MRLPEPARRTPLALALVSLAVLLATGPAPALARPARQTVAPASVGMPDLIDIDPRNPVGQVTIPGVAGRRWIGLLLRAQWPLGAGPGTIEVRDPLGRLSALRPPAGGRGGGGGGQTWRIPLRGAPGAPVELSFSSAMPLPCGQAAALALRPVALTGAPTARLLTVGSYLAGPLDRLVIRVPTPPSADVARAALRLTAAVVADDPNRSVRVEIAAAGGALPGAGDLASRVVTLDPTRPAGVSLTRGRSGGAGVAPTGPGLVVGGRGPELDEQVSLLSASLAPLLQTQSVRAVSVPGVPRYPASTLTLSDLGVRPPPVAGIGTFTVPLGFDQAQAGGELSGVDLDLVGHNAAVPPQAAATLTLLAAGSPVAATMLSSGGRWRLHGSVPPLAVNRHLELTLAVAYTDAAGHCVGSQEPLLVGVDPASSVSVTRGRPPTPPGFAEAPQAFVPETTVVLAQMRLRFLDAAASLLAGVQRMTTVPIAVTLADGARMSGDGSAQLVVADPGSALARELRPAALESAGTAFGTPGGATAVAEKPVGSMLSFGHLADDTPVIALVARPAALGHDRGLLAAVGDTPDRWFSLSGDTAVLTPDGRIASVQVAGPLKPTLRAAGQALLDHPWVWTVLGALGALGAALVTALLLARRRRPPARA